MDLQNSGNSWAKKLESGEEWSNFYYKALSLLAKTQKEDFKYTDILADLEENTQNLKIKMKAGLQTVKPKNEAWNSSRPQGHTRSLDLAFSSQTNGPASVPAG